MNPEPTLKFMLRWMGTSSLLALIFVAAPYSWMDSIHRSLGMGPLPDQPVVGYLARSTSAFYALVGGLFWVVSFDLRRYRRIVVYLGGAIGILGMALLAVDWAEGMPLFWTVWEGPFIIVVGLAISFLSRRLEPQAG